MNNIYLIYDDAKDYGDGDWGLGPIPNPQSPIFVITKFNDNT